MLQFVVSATSSQELKSLASKLSLTLAGIWIPSNAVGLQDVREFSAETNFLEFSATCLPRCPTIFFEP